MSTLAIMSLFLRSEMLTKNVSREKYIKVFQPQRSCALLLMSYRAGPGVGSSFWRSRAPSLDRGEATGRQSIREVVQLLHAWWDKGKGKSDNTGDVLL